MEKKEQKFSGLAMSGLLVAVIMIALFIFAVYTSAEMLLGLYSPICTIVIVCIEILMFLGFFINEPNNARVMIFFGKYRGTFSTNGFFWVNPFYVKKKITLRARNLDITPIKVNDKAGNPIMIGMVLIWKVADTYKSVFEIDSSSLTSVNMRGTTSAALIDSGISKMMKSLEMFVATQSDAALREVAGKYAYDDNEVRNNQEDTLRSGGDRINQHLEKELNERLRMAGIEVVEARINNLAYAPEIAAVMLRRQQAAAIISAREKIVEGAVGMVELALKKISEDGIVELDEDKKAAMVSNLLVVLCADEAAQPVLNTGSLYQ
ncbi:regulator of protease activity HflC (stomatin/prohibitin superfamily) [Dysgonomonas sp. PH5-45]|uniref:SPFH domain-containing protein n=1 Tax=unclassified Dysgonomonas TaxID=2630389 RepID=UPI002476C79A|nr:MULTISPECIES: SPFH domain-containing protein [unclassified Dysgonomonas]MDH6355630.1 regulator of protease activity HflC (stomatin/prohibitin superfamily) [Dysgonomonas sp. PH5-45]MDH6388527.1 regulator of protease activity HflC (stomatin/prohibitin superfamily) [Dysgonomonas sp. PH5-37]